MRLRRSRIRLIYLLLFALGLSVLWIAASGAVADGPETNTVQQYTASEVDYEDGGLVLTDVRSGEQRRGNGVSRVNVDDEVVCLPTATRDCSLAVQEYRGEVNATGLGGTFRYAYLEDEFYRIAHNESDFEFEYERTDASTAFSALALDRDRLTDAEREAIDEGRVVTTRPIPHANTLVESDGTYYTIQRTGHKVYGDGGSFCSSSGDDFCNRADDRRWGRRLLRIGLGALGLVGTVVGGAGLAGEYYPAYRES